MDISLINYTFWPLLDVRLASFIAYLRGQGHRIDLIDLALAPKKGSIPYILARLEDNPPDVVALSAGMYRVEVRRLVSQIRSRLGDVPILLSGMGPAMQPGGFLRGHEGEVKRNIWSFSGEDFSSLTALLDGLRNARVPKEGHIQAGTVDVNQHYVQDYRLFDVARYFKTSFIISGFIPVYASMGCPYSCSFCNDMLRPYQHKSPHRVLDEIRIQESRHKKQGMRTLNFEDRCFGLKWKPFTEMMSQFHKEGLPDRLPWACHTRPEVITEKWAAQAAKGGCALVGVGLESADESVRRDVLNKNFSNRQFEKATSNLRKAGIQYHIYLMTNLPGTDFRTDIQSLRYALAQKPLKVNLVQYYPSPGTLLGDHLLNGKQDGAKYPSHSKLEMGLFHVLRAPYHLSKGIGDHGGRYISALVKYLLNADGERVLPLSHPFTMNHLLRRTTIDLWLEKRGDMVSSGTADGGVAH